MRRPGLPTWIFLGIATGALAGSVLHRTVWPEAREAADAAALARVRGEEIAALDKDATLSPGERARRAAEIRARPWTEGERVRHAKAIDRERTRHFRATFFGGLADGVGRMFLMLLKMVVLPLVIASLISGVAGLGDARRFGRLAGRTVLWYVTTSLIAAVTGLAIVNLVHPGRQAPPGLASVEPPELPESIWEVVLNMLPENPFAAAARFDMFPVIVFSLLFGVFLLRVGAETRAPVERFFAGVFEVMMKMTGFVLALAPVGIAGLIASLVATTGPEVFLSLIGYVVSLTLGLALHAFGTLPLLVWLFTRRNPYRMMRAVGPALLTAFSTASSAATLPLTMERVEKGVGVSRHVVAFVLPVGATVNMDGTALYECLATVFVAQMVAHADPTFTLTFGTQVTIVLLALMISIGAAGIPHAGLVMMVIIFSAVGLPVELTGLLWAVDRPLDMCRTVVNVWSDICAAIVVGHHEGAIQEPAPAHAAPRDG